MQQALRYEAEYFDDKKRLLRAIFNETLNHCAEAYRSKNVSKDKYAEMGLKKEDERYIRNMIENPISIVLLGNRPSVKARIVNYILGYELLPVFDFFHPDYSQARRSVRIVYGTQRRQAFCLKNFELLDCVPSQADRVVSFEDLRLDPPLIKQNNNGNDATSCNPGDVSTPEDSDFASTSEPMMNSLSIAKSERTPTTLPLSSMGTNSSESSLQANEHSASVAYHSHLEANNVANEVEASGVEKRRASVQLHRHLYRRQHFYRQQQQSAAMDDDEENYADGDDEDDRHVEVEPNTGSYGTTNASMRYSMKLAPEDDSDHGYDDDDDEENDEDELDFYNEESVAMNGLATLEIILPHELLEKNLQIRIAPDVEDFDVIYRTTFHKVNPIILYCFERYDEKLSKVDISHLEQLRTILPSSPILFAHIVDFDPSYHGCMSFSSSAFSYNSPRNSFFSHVHPPHLAKRECGCAQCDLSSSEQQHGAPKGAQHVHDSSRSQSPQAGVMRHSESLWNCQCETLVTSTSSSTSCSRLGECANLARRLSKHASLEHLSRGAGTTSTPSSGATLASELNYYRATESLYCQLRDLEFFQERPSSSALQAPFDRQQKRQSNGYYIINDRPFKCMKQNADYGLDTRSRFISHSYEFCYFVDFFRAILKSNLVVASTLLNEIHNQFIQYFIFSAFDMTWCLNHSIPKRLEYAKVKEEELYMSLMGIANRKQDEIRALINEMLEFMRHDILNQAAAYNFIANIHAHKFSHSQLRLAIQEIQEFVLEMLNRAVAVKLITSVDVMRDTFIGTLRRCLKTLEHVRHEVSQTHSKRITSPASMCAAANETVEMALARLLDSAYSIDLSKNTSNSFVRSFWDKTKQFFSGFSNSLTKASVLDEEWKRKVAAEMIDNLCEAKLAKAICTQFRDRLKAAHETFIESLLCMENSLHTQLKEMDARRQHVRKVDAPLFARLALESTSFIDNILHGPAELSKEIGRGQYGVVFSTKKSWGHCSGNRVAVKSIMICDDKHWNDLAMEFYYTRSLPENDRIVQIRGSIIEHNYNGGSNYVYLIMDRLPRDLYAGLKNGLLWLTRIQIALDVVAGLRFLHNHGLIHRDIKLKNVLLDKHNRAKITDLGFCKSEVMISGSIVGTPIHMAPEVFTGKYDHMVDVYAFGILFWYICAGSVELPHIFEQCHNKDHLWLAVKKGLRPEKLSVFDDRCYKLMEHCWAGEPSKRPLLGEVELVLNQVKAHYDEMASNKFTPMQDTRLNARQMALAKRKLIHTRA